MVDLGTYAVLGVNIAAVDYEAAVERIMAAARAGRPLRVAALAVHGVMTGALDASHRHRLNAYDLLVPDGQPVRWALRWLHNVPLSDRVYGPTLMLRLCERAATEGLPVYFYGSRRATLRALEARLRQHVPRLQIAGSAPSAFRILSAEEQQALVGDISGSGARLVFVGLGCPRQEIWGYENGPLLGMPAVAVGAAFDFHAGTVAQAPAWMQRTGLEWSFRFMTEPRRLWRRYLLLNPLYLVMVAAQKLGLLRLDAGASTAPLPVRVG
jgi:N-acetylglucosaminyldiphosphoundecaprenol N-acetyl-beta-D-mannosaminyltransferase